MGSKADEVIGRFEAWFAAQGWPPTVRVLLGKETGLADGDVWLKDISVGAGMEGKGVGRAILGHLLALADAAGVPVTLEASEVSPSSDWLQDWYGRLGFEYADTCGDYGPFMTRQPGHAPVPGPGR